MMATKLLTCFSLALLVSESYSCSGDLIDCDQSGGPHCVCFIIAATVSGEPRLYRTCTTMTTQNYGAFGVLEIQPGSFQHADNLLSINLSDNAPPELNISSRSFVGLTNLTILNLQGNGLSALPDCLFSPMTALETLYLQSNNLTELNSKAFTNASSLKTLYLDDNKLTELPPDLLDNLPSLTTISLSSNMWNCSSTNVATLVELVHSGLVVNADQLMCANSTPVTDIVIEGPTLISSSSITPHSTSAVTSSASVDTGPGLTQIVSSSITPHSTSSVNPSPSVMFTPTPQPTSSPSVLPTPAPSPQSPTPHPTSSPSVLPTPAPSPQSPTPHPTSSPSVLPTPAPSPQSCDPVENSGTMYGIFDWPETAVGETANQECPHGPEGGVASRECGEGGRWGGVDGRECKNASERIQRLITIAESELTPSTIESVSSSLSSALSSPVPLTLDEVEVVMDVVEELIAFDGANVMVLNNSLQAVDYLLSYSGDSVLEGGPDIADRLRLLIDTALLTSLSSDNPHLVLMFAHLAVGGVYISNTNHTHILAVISTSDDGEEELVIGEEGEGGGDVEVEIEGELDGPVQVTVYNNTGLFNTSGCGSNEGVQGNTDLAPVISVSDEPTSSPETITITYHGVEVSEGEDVLCVRWNETLNCGRGGWQTDGCQLSKVGSDIICECVDNGTFGLLDKQSVPSDSASTGVVEYVFYGCCVLAAILYLPIIMAVICHRYLRTLPLKQCLANMAGSQALSLVALAASYHPHSPHQLCYSLAVTKHYTVLVALAWLAVYPIMAVLKVFRRTWFERWWLLAPVAGVCWILPAVVIGAVAVSRYGGFTDTPQLCWLEADVFPNYFTFLSAFVMGLTLLLSILAVSILYCSDYDLELPVHLRIVSSQVNAILYSATVIAFFLTADSVSRSSRYRLNTDYLLLAVAILALFTAAYFLLGNGWANSHIRSVLLCREDPVLKRKVAHYHDYTHTSSSLSSSRTSEHRNMRRNGTHINDEMNLNYVNSYLGYDEVPAPHVPLDMLGQVDQRGRGRRVKDKRNGELKGGPTGFRNVGFIVPHTTSMTSSL